jgi:hypothetical protein
MSVSFTNYECEPVGECLEDPTNSTHLSKYACERGCEADETASAYWTNARDFVHNVLTALVPAEGLGFKRYTQCLTDFYVKESPDVLHLHMFVSELLEEPQKYMFQFFRRGEDEPLRSFYVDVSKPNTVMVTSENFFVLTQYDAFRDKVGADHYFFIMDFVALGFCKKHDVLEMRLSDEWATTKRMTDGDTVVKVTFDSFWILLGRGFTYYENRGYREYEGNPFKVKEYVLKNIGTLQCGKGTVLNVAKDLFAAKKSTNDFTVQFLKHFGNAGTNLPFAVASFKHFCTSLKTTKMFETFRKQKQYYKNVRDVTRETIRHLVFYARVDSTPI